MTRFVMQCLLCSLFASQVLAGSNAIDNGGEFLAVRFRGIGDAIYKALNDEEAKLLSETEMEKFRTSLNETRVNAVQGPIFDARNRQVDARFIKIDQQSVIEIDRAKWEKFFATRSEVHRLVFHEYLRTIAVDDNNYRISAKLKNYASAIYAAEQRTNSGKIVLQEPTSDYVYENSSEANRDRKNFYLMPGFGFDLGIAALFKAGYFLNANSVLEYYGAGSTTIFFGGAIHHSLAYKHFFGNSFYAATGLGYRRIIFDDHIFTAFGLQPVTYEQRDIGWELYIGNQWQWNHFTMGVDWLGVYMPIHTIRNDDDHGLRNDYKLVRFSLGFSF